MRRTIRALLPLLFLAPAGCVFAPENGTITDQDVDDYVVAMAGFTSAPGRTVQMEVLSPPTQDPFAPTSTWEPLGDPVTSSLTPFGFGYDNLFQWNTSVPLADAGSGNAANPLLTWRDEGLLRLRAREVESNALLMTFDDRDCLYEHLGEPALDVARACGSPYAPVITILSAVDSEPAPLYGGYLDRKNNTDAAAVSMYASFGFSPPSQLRFGDWKDAHGFESNNAVEARYFNGTDLRLGRDMHCRHVYADDPGEVCEGNSSGAGELLRTACFVTNYGDAGGDPHSAFDDMGNNLAQATVAMEKHHHPPNMAGCAATLAAPAPEENDVRFFIFGHGGNTPSDLDVAQTSVKLDEFQLAQAAPGVCLNCHGGNIEFPLSGAPVVTGAKFLPFDVDLFEFDQEPNSATGSQASQMEAFRQLNEIVLDTEQEGAPDHAPASQLAELIMTWYGGVPSSGAAAVRVANTPYDGDALPSAWIDPYDPTKTFEFEHDLYGDVIRPFCRTCHIAFEDNNVPGTNAPAPGWDITFASPQSYENSAATAASFVCQQFLMPHARVTSELFWQSNARMIVANEGGLPTDCTPYP